MTGFSADWLALREPHDHRARNPDVLNAATAHHGQRAALAIIDLGCGSGSTLRALAPRFAGRQKWHLIDNDAALLARIDRFDGRETLHCDLATGLDKVFEIPADLVVTSALLDLVSATWLDRLATLVARHRLPFYAALSYDGTTTFEAVDPLDQEVIAAVNRHQRRDKGFGPALGPAAASTAIDRFRAAGYAVVDGHSDWIFEPEHRDIQMACLSGWAAAAGETGDLAPAAIAGWLDRRQALVEGGQSRIRVGHVDFFAAPTMAMRSADRSQSNNTSCPS